MVEQPQTRYVITPEPTEEEERVIIKAVNELWPRETIVERSTRWRFSGRWWAKQTDQETLKKRWR